MQFTKAKKSQSKLRMSISGLSGCGKTYTALSIGRGISPDGRIAVIDTEHGSASKYADLFDFDVLELADHHPTRGYVKAIEAAEAEGYDVLVIDSMSHEWVGTNGCLEEKDRLTKRSRSGNSYSVWGEITPLHNAFIRAIVSSKCHIIGTMRAKMDYALEKNSKGKLAPRKVGLAPVQRDEFEYEFDIVAEMDLDHRLVISKTRCQQLDGAVIDHPGEELGRTLAQWLGQGVSPEERPDPVAAPSEDLSGKSPKKSGSPPSEDSKNGKLLNGWLSKLERYSSGTPYEATVTPLALAAARQLGLTVPVKSSLKWLAEKVKDGTWEPRDIAEAPAMEVLRGTEAWKKEARAMRENSQAATT